MDRTTRIGAVLWWAASSVTVAFHIPLLIVPFLEPDTTTAAIYFFPGAGVMLCFVLMFLGSQTARRVWVVLLILAALLNTPIAIYRDGWLGLVSMISSIVFITLFMSAPVRAYIDHRKQKTSRAPSAEENI